MTDSSTTLSPLHATHTAAGASFTDFAGWQMPVRYGSDLAEHHAVRTGAGLFDISHMAELSVTGPQAAAFLDYALAANVSALPVSRAKYTMILDESGGIIDDLIVYQNAPGEYLVVANAGNRVPVVAALKERIHGFDAALTDGTEAIALIAVQGPAARSVLEHTKGLAAAPESAMGHTLATLPYYACMGMRFEGRAVLVARTGYTGEDGFELFVGAGDAASLWSALLVAGERFGLVACGLAARDTLRLEAGMPLYGHELSLDVQPAQVGLGRVIPLNTKSADFVGRAALEKGAAPDARVLVGLVSEGKRAGRAGYPIYAGTEQVGEITSGALSPTLGHPIAMALVDPAVSAVGTSLDIDVRGSRIHATVVSLPFYSRQSTSKEHSS
ncbi:glycine cleavage system aminomethyltransferase GcvT [Antiquaquibacter oligotrophicus]|uniref:glycine cleavage system aminomethyltransferase GcvT n=1 Tax=Antiquaquibacter oligotrophicus TaxID=2880260 RepID=UPI002AC8ABC6|nr:glycine cleavage system aminomethyltransferase GcvT [Antiquaquibacter oligotrophicus]UDF13882.1 glycine cleavage system aminomethyltransferase GcvT [Antiquaquibacter oligotrophicus]